MSLQEIGNLSLRQENQQSSSDSSQSGLGKKQDPKSVPSRNSRLAPPSGSLGGRVGKTDNDHNQPGPSGTNQTSIQSHNDRQSGSAHKQHAQDKSQKGSKEGKMYEKLSLALIAERGYELSKSKDNKYRDFSIGREVTTSGKEEKFDDIVFKYKDRDDRDNLIFVQIKHKQDDYKINSDVLSTEAAKAKRRFDEGHMARDFNLQKYFISYLNTKEALKVTKNKNIKGGRIKHIAIFTNVALDTVDLEGKGFKLEKVSDDVETLFTLKGLKAGDCYQLLSINDGLRKILEKSSDLHRTAKELAKFVIWEKHRQKNIMGIDDVPIKHYHAALVRKVIDKSDEVFTDEKNRKFCKGKFKTDFIDNADEPWSRQLRDAILEAIRELDDSKRNSRNDELKEILRKASWRLVPDFGVTQPAKVALPDEWRVVTEQDIADFLKCLLFIVNQPSVQELEALINGSARDTAFKVTLLRRVLDKIESIGPEFRQRIEKVLGIDKKNTHKEKWISGEEIVEFVKEQSQVVEASFIVTAMTLIYESEVMQHGTFGKLGKLIESLDNFLQNSDKKVLCIDAQETTLSSIKILQHFSTKGGYKAENGRISINSEILKGEGKNSVLKAFELEFHSLLIIECRHTLQEEDSEELYNRLSDITKPNGKKKLIIITQEHDPLAAKFEKGFSDKYVREKDERNSLIDFTDDSQEKFLYKGTVTFQGKGVRLGTLIDEGSKHLVDGEVLSKIINDEKIEIGNALTDSKYDDVKNYYIDRKLNRQVKIRQEIKREISEFLVIVNRQVDESKLENNQDIVSISDAADIFKDLCAEHKERNIHWLKEQGDDLIWQQSYGALSKLRRFLDADAQTIQEYKPEKITDMTDRLVIIAAEPGMGKSTLLTPLALKTKEHTPSLWVMRINLLNYSTELKVATEGKIKFNEQVEAIKFLYKTAGFRLFQAEKVGASAEKREERRKTIEEVLDAISVKDSQISLEGAEEEIKGLNLLEIGLFNEFSNQGRIALLFDGFDEISPDYKDQAIKLLQVLRGTKAEKIWVATRSYNNIQNELEDKLSVFSYSLKPFLPEEQRQLLRKFWKAKLKLGELDQQRSGVFIEELLDTLPKYTGNEDFMSIPLHAFMVAEVFKDAFKSFYDSEENELSEKAKQEIEKQDTLYERFIGIKFHEIRFGEKKPGTNTDDPDMKEMIEDKYKEFIADHTKLALYAIFDKYKVEKLLSKKEIEEVTKSIGKISLGKEKTGLIERVVDNKPRFVHRTFAEYFVASYFWESFKSVQFDTFEDFFENFIIENLIKDERIQISKFLQLRAKKDLESNIDFPDKHDKLRTLFTKLLDQTTEYGPDGNGKQSTKLLFGIIEFSFLTEERGNLDAIKNNDQLKLLCVSAEMGYIILANALATKLDTKFLEQYLRHDKWFYSPFWIAAENSQLDILGILVKKFSYDPNWKDKDSKSLVGRIFQMSAFNVLRSCLKLDVVDGKPYKKLNRQLELPIVEAFTYSAPSDVIKLLLKKTDSNLVNRFKSSKNKLSPAQLISVQLLNYDKEIAELTIKKGIDFSEVINLLLFEFCEESLLGLIRKLTSNRSLSQPSFHSDKEFLNCFERIELLLKGGVGYNSKDKSGTTTLQYGERIYYIQKLLDGVHKLHNQKNDTSSNPLGTILKLIIDTVGIFASHEFEVNSSKQEIRLWLWYWDKSLLHRIPLLPNKMPKILQSYEDSNTNLVENTFKNIRDYVTNAEKEIMAFKQYPGNKMYYTVSLSYKEMLQYGFYGFSPTEGEEEDRYQFLGVYEKNLLEEVLNLYIRQDYEVNDALKEVSEKVFRFVKIINRLKENSGDKKYAIAEIVDILALKSTDTNEELRDLISKIHECGGIELLHGAWSYLNYIGQQRMMGVLELLFKFADRSSKIFELFKKLDDPYKTLTKAIVNKNYQEMNNTLQNIEPDFIKATVNGQDDEHGSPLHYAACKGDVEATRILLDRGANANLRLRGGGELLNTVYYYGCTPLHLAALNGHSSVTEIMVKFDADPNAADNYGGTPLHRAAFIGDVESIQILLDHGANPNAQDDCAWTPLHRAAYIGNVEATQILLNHGANPNLRMQEGSSMSSTSVTRGDCTPLHLAALNGQSNVADILVKFGADPNAADNHGWTPLHGAAYLGDVEAIQILLDLGAHPNLPMYEDGMLFNIAVEDYYDGCTPYKLALLNGHFNAAEILINFDTDAIAEDNHGWTPLHGASLVHLLFGTIPPCSYFRVFNNIFNFFSRVTCVIVWKLLSMRT